MRTLPCSKQPQPAGHGDAGGLEAAVVGADVPDFVRSAVGVEDPDGVVVGPNDVDVADRGTREAVAVDGGGDAFPDVFGGLFLFRACTKQHGRGREEGECVMSHLSRGV